MFSRKGQPLGRVTAYTGGELLRKPFNRWIFHVRAGYADETEHMVKQPQAVIMVAINKPAAAFVWAYREVGGGGQLFNISVVDPAEPVKEGGLENVRGLGISLALGG